MKLSKKELALIHEVFTTFAENGEEGEKTAKQLDAIYKKLSEKEKCIVCNKEVNDKDHFEGHPVHEECFDTFDNDEQFLAFAKGHILHIEDYTLEIREDGKYIDIHVGDYYNWYQLKLESEGLVLDAWSNYEHLEALFARTHDEALEE